MSLRERRMLLELASLYLPKRNLALYAIGKIALDPAYRVVRDRLLGSTLPMIDAGCGIGLLAAYLRESGCSFPIKGIDLDAGKIAAARAAAARRRYPAVAFCIGDAAKLNDFNGNVVLLDVIHYFDNDAQRSLLARIAEGVPCGGRVIIRIAINDGSARYLATCIEEWFIKAIGWIEGGALNFPTIDAVAAPFRELDYRETIRPLWGKTPFNSYFFEFQRDGRAGSA